MEVAPAFALLLCVSMRVSLAERRHFEEANSTSADESVDYKDPCKAGTLQIYVFIFFSNLYLSSPFVSTIFLDEGQKDPDSGQ